jgi:AraC family transcriptional regulator of adaptative response/methylated-DNA-[protein]-cysteine methyltransferase
MPACEQQSFDYERIEKVIRFIRNSGTSRPTLSEIAAGVDLSARDFQKLFSRWAGVGPEQFLRYLTREYAKKQLDSARPALETSRDVRSPAGFARPADPLLSCETIPIRKHSANGQAPEITWGVHPSPFGECFLSTTPQGICSLFFMHHRSIDQMTEILQTQWPGSVVRHSNQDAGALAAAAFHDASGNAGEPIRLHVRGTRFQLQVWKALLRIPFGGVVSYEDIARHIRKPRAARAVGNAVGQNPVSFLIPCHRVIQKTGGFGNYGGGRARKLAMLGWEAARAAS